MAVTTIHPHDSIRERQILGNMMHYVECKGCGREFWILDTEYVEAPTGLHNRLAAHPIREHNDGPEPWEGNPETD